MANIINSLAFGTGTYVITLPYATCNTAAGTQAKVATLTPNTNWSLETGSRVSVKFDAANSASSPTLNVNQSGAKTIRFRGAALTSSLFYWAAGSVVDFVYDGTYWNMTGSPHNYDSNTTYSLSSFGVTASATELNYTDGVTSNIQTQLNNRVKQTTWNSTVTCAKWSRLCHVAYHTSTVGSKFLINVRATRSSVVYNDLYVVTAHHQRWGTLVKLSGSNYYGTSYKLRVIVDNGGGCYVEINDTTNGATSATTQVVDCVFIPILAGNITTYTSFTDGTTLPSDYEVAAEISATTGDLQGTLTGSLIGNASTATNVAWSGVTSKPSYYDSKAITSISRSGTTFTATYLDGTTATFSQQDNNTYGRTSNTTSKIYLMGGTSQSDSNKTTYSNVNCYASGGYLYSGGTKVSVEGHTHTFTDTNTAHSHTAGTGLTISGSGGTSGTTTYSANLNSTTSLGTIGTTSKLYAVGVDANGQLCVNVPWTDTDTNTDTKVTQAAAITATTSANYPVMLGYSTATTSVTNTLNKSAKLLFNTGTGALTVGSGSTAGSGTLTVDGDIIAGGGSDSYGIHPKTSNYSTLGKSNKYWYKVYSANVYTNSLKKLDGTDYSFTMTWNTF